MPIPIKYLAVFKEGAYYHVYNHASGKENLFAIDDNYVFFLNKLNEHLGDYIDLFAFCLMPNHFHTLIRIKLISELSKEAIEYLNNFENFNECICRKYNNFFISYSLAFNKQQNRKGNLFRKPFKRILIENETYFTRLIKYIHLNPVHHGFTKNINNYKWTSYQSVISNKPTKLARQQVLNWFNGKEFFIDFHTNLETDNFKDIEGLIIENE